MTVDPEGPDDRTYQNNDFVQAVLADSHRFATAQQPQRQDVRPAATPDCGPSPAVSRRAEASGEQSATRPPRPIPEKLKLTEVAADTGEPSPALSTASGPYIPISECFSGSPVRSAPFDSNFAPLNSLSRGRLDNVRSPLHIGHLNLTEGPPPQSPGGGIASGPGGRSSDDSESVFTDDDELASSHSGSHAGGILEAQLRRTNGSLDRRLRPSDSSIENENIGWTAVQRYSKVPLDEKKCLNSCDPPPRPPKRLNEAVMGPLDSSSCVAEERYEIPRSHRNPAAEEAWLAGDGQAEEPPRRRSHFYTNAAPSNLEGQVFCYDFAETAAEAGEAPPRINRNLKPKAAAVHKASRSCDQIETPPPTAKQVGLFGRQLRGDEERSSGSMTPRRPMGPFLTHSDDKLQYLDLDHSNPAHGLAAPSRPESLRSMGSASTQNIPSGAASAAQLALFASIKHSESSTMPGAATSSSGRGIVYKTVDFVKTEAFNRTRQDAEMNRNLKDK